ncbi:MAG: EutN/CcmL family microcompartment protein [Bacillus sp. (in: Bacteria)]|nr:EutN/CcmL family microcompartment protein [Bacillus sp. (in: firmicutes)]
MTRKTDSLKGKKLLVVKEVNLRNLGVSGKPLIAVDTVGSGIGELVMVVSGSSARQTKITNNTPVDATIAGIIDLVELEGNIVFSKHD